MYSRYISSLTRFSSILLDFLVIFLSSPFLAAVFISRVSLVLFVPFMRPFRVPLFSSDVHHRFRALPLLFTVFSLPVLFFLFFFFAPQFLQADFLRSILRSLIRTPDTFFLLECFCSALHLPAFCSILLFSTTVISRAIHEGNTTGRLLPKLNEELRDLVIFLRSSSFQRAFDVLRISPRPYFFLSPFVKNEARPPLHETLVIITNDVQEYNPYEKMETQSHFHDFQGKNGSGINRPT